ncbi:MAG: carboxylating nicotinate-nucleotide diphosphorylase [Phycisphaerales bacterium]
MSTPPPDLDALALDDLFSALNPAADLSQLFDRMKHEDLADSGDVTSLVMIDEERPGRARVVVRERGVLAGLAAVPPLARIYDARVRWTAEDRDGESVNAGASVGVLEGSWRSLLAIERPLLNLVAHLSGVATLTRRFVDAVAGTRAEILATRKTTPGLRGLEKYAVRCGGGRLHRLGLHDAILIKDNHLAGATGSALTEYLNKRLKAARSRFSIRFVEVEVDDLDQLDAVLATTEGLVDFVLLDNMPLEALAEAVRRRDAARPRLRLEASGGVTLETVAAIASTGVDRISVGALTHSAVALDVGLDLE